MILLFLQELLFEISVKGDNINTMLNCTFIKIDLLMLYHVLYNDLGNFSNSMSIFVLLLSFCLLFLLFTLISININNKEKNNGAQKKSS